MTEVEMIPQTFDRKVVAIVMFGPATSMSGMRPAEYYQVTIDPQRCSPSGEYIRFGQFVGDEITGWQRVSAMTVVEVLAEWSGEEQPKDLPLRMEPITMRAVGG